MRTERLAWMLSFFLWKESWENIITSQVLILISSIEYPYCWEWDTMSLMVPTEKTLLMVSRRFRFILPWHWWACVNYFWRINKVGNWRWRVGRRVIYLPNGLMQLAPSDCDFFPCTCPKGSWPRSRRRPRVEPKGRWDLWPQLTNLPPSSAPTAMMKDSPLVPRMLMDLVSWVN